MPKHLTKIDVVGALPPDPTIYEDGYPVFLDTDDTVYLARPNLATPAWVPVSSAGGGGGGVPTERGYFYGTAAVAYTWNEAAANPVPLTAGTPMEGGLALVAGDSTRIQVPVEGVYMLRALAQWDPPAEASSGAGALNLELHFQGDPANASTQIQQYGWLSAPAVNAHLGSIIWHESMGTWYLPAGGIMQVAAGQDYTAGSVSLSQLRVHVQRVG